MALTRNGNTLYFSTGSTANEFVPTNNTNCLVHYVVQTTNNASNSLLLYDGGDSLVKLSIVNKDAGVSYMYDFSAKPLNFPNGIRCSTVNCEATLVYSQIGT